MTNGYALQILGVILVMGVLALTTAWIASRRFDRNTAEAERRRAAE